MPTTYIKFMAGDINPQKFKEDVDNSGLVITGMGLGGFGRGDRVKPRNTQTAEVGRTVGDGETTVRTAEPGELNLRFENDLSPAEEATLDQVIADHDPLTNTVAQIRDDSDAAILAITATKLRKSEWDSLSNNQKFNVIRRCLQLLFRGNTFSDLDSDD